MPLEAVQHGPAGGSVEGAPHVVSGLEQEGQGRDEGQGLDRIERSQVDPIDVQSAKDGDLQRVLFLAQLAAGIVPEPQPPVGPL